MNHLHIGFTDSRTVPWGSEMFLWKFDSPNPLYSVGMNDFLREKRLDWIRNAKDDFGVSVHAHRIKSQGSPIERWRFKHICVN